MNEHTILPDPQKSFGIRFESIVGLKADAVAELVASTAVLRLDLNAVQFSSNGIHRKGEKQRSFIRLSEIPIRSTAPIISPDVIVVFHNALLKNPAAIAGLKADGILIYNGTDIPSLLSQIPKTVKLIRIDAHGIALKEKTTVDAVLLGTLTATLPFLDTAMFQSLAPHEKAFQRGATEFEILTNIGTRTEDVPIQRHRTMSGYQNSLIGGMLPAIGNTIVNNLSGVRTQWIPILDIEKCVHCGICDMICPDFCFVWTPIENNHIYLKGIDYTYCKACLRCVESCATGALRRKAESPGMAETLGVKRNVI